MAKLFAADDFSKEIVVGDELVFDKDIKRLRVDLTWEGTDLDVCAFLLGKDGVMTEKSDLVYYKSERRWLPNKAFDDPAFDPLDGKVSVWPAQGFKNPIKWRDATLPISGDDAVIGSWDDMSDSEECGETMHVLLDEVDVTKHKSIVIAAVVGIDKIKEGETFAAAKKPVVTITNVENDKELANYKLDAKFPDKDAVCIGKLIYDEDELKWSFVAMADGYKGGIMHLAQNVF